MGAGYLFMFVSRLYLCHVQERRDGSSYVSSLYLAFPVTGVDFHKLTVYKRTSCFVSLFLLHTL